MSTAQKRSRREYEADQLRKQESPYVVYGTPLPPLDDNIRDDGSYVPVWKQEVTDDRGRKRLHGAFTGGFSAGYFNTVGSKEGWTPSAFVSSRSNRAKDASIRQQKAEDFMDEEDLREQEEARQLATNEGFSGLGATGDDGPRDALDDLFRSNDNSMGEQLLKRMGWKQGQGIGPRVMRKIDPTDEHSEVKEFPPEDLSMPEYPQKTDARGLGYVDGDKAITLPDARRPSTKAADVEADEDEARPGLAFMARPRQKAEKLKRTGIGVGSLNDTGSDDEDPYEMGPKVSYDRAIGGDKKKGKKAKLNSTTNANPLLKSTPVFISKSKQLPTALSSLRKCHDGKLPLPGFVLSDELDNFSTLNLNDEKYRLPELPEDWHPSGIDHPDISVDRTTSIMAQVLSQRNQTSESRRQALLEPSLPSKSVFDYLSPAARDRLVTSTGNQNLPPALNEVPARPSSTTPSTNLPETLPYPSLAASTATQALSRLKTDKASTRPYHDDIPKQTRYKDFLRYSSDLSPDNRRVLPLRNPTHNANDADHLAELAEFAATAELFKPATGFLATRFTSGAASLPAQSPQLPGNPTSIETDAKLSDLLTRPAPKPTDPAEDAAKMGMFGPATRSVRSWQPTRLLCKRFGVDMPISWNEDLGL